MDAECVSNVYVASGSHGHDWGSELQPDQNHHKWRSNLAVHILDILSMLMGEYLLPAGVVLSDPSMALLQCG